MKEPNLARQTLYISVITSCAVIVVMLFLFYTGNKIAAKYAPLIDAAMEIKLEATFGHLWFEEIVSGDRHESIETVWKHIELANWYANAMLNGGENLEGIYLPMTDSHMRASIQRVTIALENFRQVAVQRYNNSISSVPGSDIDQKFDRIFFEFVSEADYVESMLQKQFTKELKQFRITAFIMLIGVLSISVFLSSFLYRREKQRLLYINTIDNANHSIKKKNAQLEVLAHFDQLTGLPNRVLFLDRLTTTLKHARRNNSITTLLFIDLDKFKSVNDQLGHLAGDKLLQEVAARMKRCVRDEDTVMRLNGDEFVILLSDIDTKSDAIDSGRNVADKLLTDIAKVYHLENKPIFISASIGIAVSPDDGLEPDTLLRNADTAMYHAKAQGKNNYQFFSKQLNEMALKRMEMEQELRTAIKERQIELYFQPQVELDSKKVVGIEALARWNHPDRGLIMPGEFIPLAEGCGLIQALDTLIMKMAFEQFQSWLETGIDPGRLSINISPISFRRSDFVSEVLGYISRYKIPAERIELEMIESVLVENSSRTQEILSQLANMRVRIAIDDFGTGYSSMAYLKDFKVHTLKIDRTFVQGYQDSNVGKAILKNMISLGQELNLTIVAEGIETKEQEYFIAQLGCHIGQGYVIARPLPVVELEEFLHCNDNNVVYLGNHIE